MFNLKIRKVKKISTKNRKINGSFPEKTTVNLIKSLAKNENSNIKERDDFEFNQDAEIEFDEGYRSPGWERFKKNKLLKWKK